MYYSIGSTIYEENVDEIEDLIAFAFEQEAAFIRFTPVVGINKGEGHSIDSNFYKSTIKKIIEQTIKYKDYLHYKKNKREPNEEFLAMMTTRRCPAGSNLFMIVDSDKNLTPCQFIPKKDGYYIDLRNYYNLENNFESLREKMNSHFKEGLTNGHNGICRNCNYINTCQGSCLANRLPKGLTISDEQPICLYHIMKDLFEEVAKENRQTLLNYWYYYYNQRITGKDKTKSCIRKLPIWEINFRMDKIRDLQFIDKEKEQ